MTLNNYEQVYNLWIHTEGMGLNTTDDSRERELLNICIEIPIHVLEDQGELVGVIMSGHDGRRGFIHHTTVRTEYRGKGIGKKLVNSALTALEKEGIHKVALVVFEKNISGNLFWEKLGFTVRDDLVYRNKNIHELTRIDWINA